MNVTKRIKLDFARSLNPVVVWVKQGDENSRFIEIVPLKNGDSYTIPSGVSIHFACKKPDGHQILNDYPTIQNNIITIPLTPQTLAADGEGLASVILMDSATETILSTQNFILYIENNPLVGAEVESSDEYQSFLAGLLKVESIPEITPSAEGKVLGVKNGEFAFVSGGSGTGGGTGEDGFSPIAKVEQTENGAQITITDKDGTTTATVMDGEDGKDGSDGVGISSVEQFVTSTSDGGSNIIKVTLTNGQTSTFTVQNGNTGKSGADGKSVTIKSVGESTEDGGSNIVTFSDGKMLTIKNGKAGRDGKDGTNGADGYTPVRGVDYWTAKDISAMKAENEAYIIEELSKRGQLKPEFAESQKWLAENGDQTKLYVLPDGYIYAWMYKEGGGAAYTNLADTKSDEWQNGKRIKNDGTIADANSTDSAVSFVSNPFTCKQGDVIRVKGVGSATSGGTATYFTFLPLDSTGTKVGGQVYIIDPPSNAQVSDTSWQRVQNQVVITDDGVYEYTILLMGGTTSSAGDQHRSAGNIVSGVVSGKATNGFENVIITINEEIKESSSGYQWANTGHAFVPADYEDRIVELEQFAEEIDEMIEQVVKDSATAFDYTAYGLPIIYLTGDTSTMNKDTKVTLDYVYGDRSGTCTVKWQGSSSLAYEKKNYTITFDNAFEAKEGWGTQKKYCAKANYIDFSHARNVVSAKLWGQVVKSRATGNANLNELVNGGAVDGFPIVIVINDVYHGLYTLNIPKDAWMFGMGSGTNECILCADKLSDGTHLNGEAFCDGTDFEIEYITNEDDTAWAVTSVNNLIDLLVASDGSDIDNVISQYVDIESAIDYLIFVLLIQGIDMIHKNYILATYDGVKWFFSAYDMDSTYGLTAYGKDYKLANANPTISSFAENNKLIKLLKNHKPEVIKTRYNTLRETVMSDTNVIAEFANFIGTIPKPVFDEDYKVWTGIPNTATNNLSQIAMHYILRAKHIDDMINRL